MVTKEGIKLLIVAPENSGKTRLISNIESGLVMSTDNKAFRGKVPHFRYNIYNGLDDLIETISSKLEAYESKFGKLPETFVIDSVTHLQNIIIKYNNDKYTGFNIWTNINRDVLAINSFIEEELIPAGINVVMTAHVVYDTEAARWKIDSPGNFGKTGSWLSIVDESVFIEVKGNKRILHFSTMKFPCRTLQADLPESINVDDFDINKHIKLLESSVQESEEWAI